MTSPPINFSQVSYLFTDPDAATLGTPLTLERVDGLTSVLRTGCPACGDEALLLRSDERVQVSCVSPDGACEADAVAFALGISVDELNAGLGDDIVLTPGASASDAQIDWNDVSLQGSVDGARLLQRAFRQQGKDVILGVEEGWHVTEGAQYRKVDESVIRRMAHDVGDRLYEAAEATRASARSYLHRADGGRPTPQARATADAREEEARTIEAASLMFRRTGSLDSIVKKELPALPFGRDADGREVLVSRSVTEFDRDPDVLGVRNGVLDLRTGTLRDYRKTDLITKIADVDFDPDAKAPLWEQYLSEVFIAEDGGPDPEFVQFMARLVGYGITGHTREHVLPVLFGNGQNGKSVFLETLTHLFSQYAKTTPFETFVDKPSGGIPNDIAALRGSRLVMASEGAAGRPMDEAVIKRLTGGDTIAARFLNREFFEFTPSFLILLATNYKPAFRGQDEGLWRRVKLVPFRARFPITMPENPSPFDRPRDSMLTEKLRAEAPGILAWAVRGAQQWYAEGLRIPASIERETSDYRAESDSLGEFIADTLDVTGEHTDVVFLTDLFPAYTAWSKEADENGHTFGRKLFSQMIGERPGVTRAMRGGKAIYRGVRILTVHEQTARKKASERELRAV